MLRARNLTCRLGGHPAVQDASLDVPAGALVALSGPSGCGKSTLLRLLCGLVDRDAGAIALDATPIPPPHDRAGRRVWHREVLLLPQDTSRAFNPVRPLRPQFRDALALHGLGVDAAARDRIAAAAMDQVGLPTPMLDRHAAQLSGGQRQRAALARLLCLRPRVLLLDEPSSALDPATTLELLDLVNALRRAADMAVLMTTHDPRLAACADRALAMRPADAPGPQITAVSPPSTVSTDPVVNPAAGEAR